MFEVVGLTVAGFTVWILSDISDENLFRDAKLDLDGLKLVLVSDWAGLLGAGPRYLLLRLVVPRCRPRSRAPYTPSAARLALPPTTASPSTSGFRTPTDAFTEFPFILC